MRRQRVHNPRYLEKYFTMFPNIIDDSDLTPFEFRLLIHYYRVGECWEGVRKTAEICHMSTGMVSNCRNTLAEKGFISVKDNGIGESVIITLVDLSEMNRNKYHVHAMNDSSQDEPSVHQDDADSSQDEHKKNQYKKNQLRIDESSKEDSFRSLTVESDSPTEEDSSAEPQRGARAKKPKKAKMPDPSHAFCRDVWIREYPLDYWNGASGKSLNQVIAHIRNVYVASGKTIVTPEMVNEAFEKIVLFAKEPANVVWASGRGMPVFASKLGEILDQMKNGKKTSSDYQRRLNEADAIRRLPEQDF